MISTSKQRFLLCAAGLVLLCAVISRVAAVLYSTAATDILYSETILPNVLTWLRQIFSAVSFGAGIAAVTAAAYSFGNRTAAGAAGLHIAVLLLDAASAFVIDAGTGAVSASLLPLAAMINLGEWLFSTLLVLTAYFLVQRMVKKQAPAGRAVLVSSLVYLGGRMALQLFYILQFLIDVEFAPYASEIVQMLGEVLQLLFLSGVVWLSAAGVQALLGRIRDGKR